MVELYLLVNFHAVDTGSSPGQWGQVETVITLAVNGAMLSLQQTGGQERGKRKSEREEGNRIQLGVERKKRMEVDI